MSTVAIIGMGAICSAGANVEQSFAAVVEGRDGLSPLTDFDTGLKTLPLCSPVSAIPHAERAPNRTAALALCAAREALLKTPRRQGLRLHIITATTVAGMTRSETFYRNLRQTPETAPMASEELRHHEPAALSAYLCEMLEAQSFCTLSTACSTGLHAVGLAKRAIERGADLCLAVGADALSVLTIRGFSSLMLIDPTGCKPFDKRRAGISLGEGAGAILLASPKAATLLGAEPIAYASGWAASADCHHMTAPHPSGDGARRSITAALDEARVSPSDIGFIATHGTATPDNDLAEIAAIRSVFGTLPPFCSMKRTIGHTLAASGILEAVFAIRAMQSQCALPTAGFERMDEAIGCAPASGGALAIRHVLKNAFGFGGNNASAVFSREAPHHDV